MCSMRQPGIVPFALNIRRVTDSATAGSWSCVYGLLTVLFLATGCGGGDGGGGGTPGNETLPPGAVTFHFKMYGDASGVQDFQASATDPELIASARAQLDLPVEERKLHIDGQIAAGNGGDNLNWSWHYVIDHWKLAEVSIEVCDGNAVLVNQAVDYWVNTMGRFCPWGAYVASEVPSH